MTFGSIEKHHLVILHVFSLANHRRFWCTRKGFVCYLIMARTRLPPGFRFHPTDVELIMYYLKRKVLGKRLRVDAIAEVNIYNFSPWDLPDKSCLRNKDLEWFFFCPRERKYSSGARVKRATDNGYWKTTGKERPIVYNDRNVGSVKTLVFHLGHAPKGDRTDWVIHEYKITDEQLSASGLQDSYVLCKVFKKSGLGPKNGAQYGAPFNEAEWEDDEVNECADLSTVLTSVDPSVMSLVENQSWCAPEQSMFEDGPKENQDSVATNLDGIGNTSQVSLIGEGPSALAGPVTNGAFFDMSEDEVNRLFSAFTDDNALLSIQDRNHMEDHNDGENNSEPCLDIDDVFNGLGDLEKDVYHQNNLLLQDNLDYIELNDLLSPLDYNSEVTGIDQLNDIFGSYKENMQQSYFANGSAGINHYGYCESQLPVLPAGPNREDSNLNVLHMANEFDYGHSDIYDSELTQSQPLNGENRRQHTYQDNKRGKEKQICTPRILRSTPSWSPIAAQQSAPSFPSCYYDSSIHIKAEVTYGTGECTKDALSGMMEESSSSLWNQPWAQVLLFLLYVGSHPFACFWFVFVSMIYLFHFVSLNSSFICGTIYALTNIVLAKLLIYKYDHDKNDSLITNRRPVSFSIDFCFCWEF